LYHGLPNPHDSVTLGENAVFLQLDEAWAYLLGVASVGLKSIVLLLAAALLVAAAPGQARAGAYGKIGLRRSAEDQEGPS
jgi:hypothetical protein